MNLAMWSGPRNLSTALMRAFAQRSDTEVVDEPLYAAYLYRTGLDHPMREAVLASQPTDWRRVTAELVRPVVGLRFQKHMAHHLLDAYDTDWLDRLVHGLLLRHPARVLASYARKRADVAPADLGYAEQVRIMEHCRSRGIPLVFVHSHALGRDPGPVLRHLCRELGVRFEPAMLSWEPGPRAEDGVWGAHWYDAVRRSTGFRPEPDALPEVPARYRAVFDAVLGPWERLVAGSGG